MEKSTIAIASDHAGYKLKEQICEFLKNSNYQLKDFGTYNTESVDYPDFGHPMSASVQKGEYNFGIIICGSGNGMSMVANKYENIRSAVCWCIDIAILARSHNNANICSLPARFISYEDAKEIVYAFLKTDFDGGRHLVRVNNKNKVKSKK